MPIIRFTTADLLAGKLLDKGGYTAELVSVSSPKASSSQKSVTFETLFRISKGPNAGKEFEVFFNTETNGNSLLGTRQYAPHNWLLTKVAPAILNLPPEQVPLDLDTDSLVGKSLDIVVGVQTSEGNILNLIMAFAPEGKSQGTVPF